MHEYQSTLVDEGIDSAITIHIDNFLKKLATGPCNGESQGFFHLQGNAIIIGIIHFNAPNVH